jgi:hypothetical protein
MQMTERVAFDWPAPTIPGPWRTLDASESMTLAARLGNALGEDAGRMVWHTEVLAVRAMPLSFYKDWLLVEFAARLDGEPRLGLASFLYGPGMRLAILDLTSGPIHAVNERHLLPLETPQLAGDYLRFFCSHITGDEGRFRIVESLADVPLAEQPAGTPPAVGPMTLSRLDKPKAEHAWSAKAFVLYGPMLFQATYEIVDGSVQMVDDDAHGTLAVREEKLAPPFRFPA